jgi:BirA family biotin operon repressor/biotin-[acetyl-CoA-carboxylase] ligase
LCTILLNKDKILQLTADTSFTFDLKIFNIIDSTNSFLLNNSRSSPLDNNSVPVIAAEIQTKGRGRIGRAWHSELGCGLTFSLLWCFKKGTTELSGLSLTIGVAIIRVLRSFSINQVKLKWPNDLLHNNCKLCGILVELRGKANGSTQAVIGIGVNFNLSSSLKSIIQQDVTDLYQITGKYHDRNVFLSALLLELCNILSDFQVHGFSYFRDEWISYHAYQDKNVKLNLPNNSSVIGRVDGINADGSLCLLTSAGYHSFSVGDISLRLID